ncbi:MAG: hypothetical protein GY804_14765 [Alphaproteobacteria bacterium]|nr:hypothetical protein [Alphaproteobacteria bacterium]
MVKKKEDIKNPKKEKEQAVNDDVKYVDDEKFDELLDDLMERHYDAFEELSK